MENIGVRTLLKEIVMASPTKAIIKIDPGISIESLKQALSGYNRSMTATFRQLFGFDGRYIWREHLHFINDRN